MKKFVKGLGIYAILAIVVASSIYYMAVFFGDKTVHVAKKQWHPAEPQDQGINPRKLKRALEYIEARLPAARGLIIIKNGKTILEKYYWKGGPQVHDYLHSANSIVLHALLGIALHDQEISLAQPLTDFFPEYTTENSIEAPLELNDLLTVSAPLAWGDDQPEYWQLFYAQDKVSLSLQILAENRSKQHSAAVFASQYLLSNIIERITGKDLFTFAEQRLFQPMEVTILSESAEQGSLKNSFVGFQLKTLDLAKFGYLVMNQGEWQGKQLIPKDWFARIENLHAKGQKTIFGGWQPQMFSGARGVVAVGEGGQYIVLIPEFDMVIAVSSKSLFPVARNSGYDSLFSLIVESVQGEEGAGQVGEVLAEDPGPVYFKPNFVFSTKVPEDVQQFLYTFARDIAENDIKKVLYHYAKGYEKIDRRYLIPTRITYRKMAAEWGKIFAGGSGVLQSVQVEKIRVDGNRAYMRGLLKHSYANMNEGSLGWFPIENLIKIRGRWMWLGFPEFGDILDRDEYFDVETTDDIAQFLKQCQRSLTDQAGSSNCFADDFTYNGLNAKQLKERIGPLFENPKKATMHCNKVIESGEDRIIEGYLAGSMIGELQLPPALRISKNNGKWQWAGNRELQ